MVSLKDDRVEYDRTRYLVAKARLIEMAGGVCAQCGSTEDLQFDHIDRLTKSFVVLAAWNKSDDVVLPEMAKCQLLCKSCHLVKTSSEVSVPHGGGLTGKKSCECGLCAPLKRAYSREYKRRWRAARKATQSFVGTL